MYTVYDRYGEPVKSGFSTARLAYNFLTWNGRYDWTVKLTRNEYRKQYYPNSGRGI